MHLYQLIQWTPLIPAILTINPPNLEKAEDNRAKLLKMTVINFCSVIGKKADLLELIATHNPHIIIGTETWLSSDISNNEIIPSDLNYNIYWNDHADGYGGVMLAITNQITSLEIPNLTTNCEIVWAQINLPDCNKLFIGAYYRPHTNDQLSIEELNLSLCKLESQNSNVTIWLGGDFNAPGIDWQTLTLRNECAYIRLCA